MLTIFLDTESLEKMTKNILDIKIKFYFFNKILEFKQTLIINIFSIKN